MRITISPSEPQDDDDPELRMHRVSVEDVRDDLSVNAMFSLFEYALLGSGFGRESIEKFYAENRR